MSEKNFRILSEGDWKLLRETLESPPNPSKGLNELFDRYKPTIDKNGNAFYKVEDDLVKYIELQIRTKE